jgi:hypothetical protein
MTVAASFVLQGVMQEGGLALPTRMCVHLMSYMLPIFHTHVHTLASSLANRSCEGKKGGHGGSKEASAMPHMNG